MSSVRRCGAAVTTRSLASLCAARVRELRAAGRDARAEEGRLLLLLEPWLRREAGKFRSAAGTVQWDDLIQEASLRALRVCDGYRLEDGDFHVVAFRPVRRALRDYVGAHGLDVRPSYHARRGRGRPKVGRCEVVQVDGEAAGGTEWAHPEALLAEGLELRQVRRAVRGLTLHHRQLIEAAFGLAGARQTSARGMAQELGIGRRQVDAQLREALEALRLVLVRKGRRRATPAS